MDEYDIVPKSSGGGTKGKGGFVGGVLIGGAVFGALGFLFAPQLSKHILKGKKVLDDLLDDDADDDEESFLEEEDRDDVAHRYDEDGNLTSALASSSMRLEKRAEKELEETRKSLNQKIAELNRAIDEFSEEADARLTAKLGRLSDELDSVEGSI